MTDESSSFVWSGTPTGSGTPAGAENPAPPPAGRKWPSARILIVTLALGAGVTAALVVALGGSGAGSPGPSAMTFRSEVAAICNQTQRRVLALGTADPGNLPATLDRDAGLASTMVRELAAVTPPANDTTAYRTYISDVSSEIQLLRRITVALKDGNTQQAVTLEQQAGATSATVDQDVAAAGIGCASAGPTQATNQQPTIDAAAKELAHTAQVAAETYATDKNGSYSGITPAVLKSYETTIQITPGNGNAYVSRALSTATSYTITTTPASGHETFSIIRTTQGTIARTCNPPAESHSGCNNGTW